MSWLRQSISSNSDLRAVVDSFCKHWDQISEFIGRSETSPTKHDDALAVVNHLHHMVTLLLVELQNCNQIALPGQHPIAPCLEFMLSENLLDKLFEWSLGTGKYLNCVRLEQLKLYELLISHSRHQLLVHEPFLRPLLKLLSSCQDEIFPSDVGKRLVILLNQLCVCLMHNINLLDLFFCSSQKHNQTNFIIFSLLLPYVHCEGSLGHSSRDALLLCMSLSQKNSNIGMYIANHSSMAALVISGICGLYSSLPNVIEIHSADWFRITADDEIPEIILFMNSLEFCNAVVQVAHPLISEQLLDFLYQGFLVPVLGPAILQKLKGSHHLQTNVDSQVTAMIYLDLILRSVTDPGLLPIMIKFLLDEEKFDEIRIIDVLIERINSPDSRLCMVTITLFDTLMNLQNEKIMIELILKYLVGAPHVPIAQKHKINKIQSYAKTVDYFLDLAPDVMKNSNKILAEHKSLDYQQQTSLMTVQKKSSVSITVGTNWNHYGLYTNGESLYSNYHGYLYDAHQKTKQIKKACDFWTNNYFYKGVEKQQHTNSKINDHLMQTIRSFLSEFGATPSYSDLKCDSLHSIGESSGYESMKYRPDEDEEQTNGVAESLDRTFSQASSSLINNVKILKNIEPWRRSNLIEEQIIELDFNENVFNQGTVSLGPFLTAVWSKIQTFTSNLLYVNIHLTGLISHMALYPLPLLHSILLRPDIPTTSDIPSFYQVLKILKQQIDAELPMTEDSLQLIDVARTLLIDREFKLINARKIALESLKTNNRSYTLQPLKSQQSVTEPFKRHDEKRKSSIMNLFRRSSVATSSTVKINQGLTNNISEPPNSLELQSSIPIGVNTSSYVNERQRDLAIAAIIMDEFLKELSAISQEMSIVLLNENMKMS